MREGEEVSSVRQQHWMVRGLHHQVLIFYVNNIFPLHNPPTYLHSIYTLFDVESAMCDRWILARREFAEKSCQITICTSNIMFHRDFCRRRENAAICNSWTPRAKELKFRVESDKHVTSHDMRILMQCALWYSAHSDRKIRPALWWKMAK